MKEEQLDAVLVPLGLLVLGAYHVWLAYTVMHNPRKTVIGLNAEIHRQWIVPYMADPLNNGTLAIQTFRNSMMASSLLATTAITLSSIIAIFLSNASKGTSASSDLIYGNKTPLISSLKYFTLIICFLVGFLCNIECLRYYAHVSFLVTLPTSQGNKEAMEYAARSLNRASLFWSFGLRAFYLAFSLFIWLFGPIPMFVCSCIMSGVLYILDTTFSFTQKLHRATLKEKNDDGPESPLAI